MDGARRIPTLWLSIHCQSKIYTACSRIKADFSSTVFAHELTTRSAGFDAENRLYLFAVTMPGPVDDGVLRLQSALHVSGLLEGLLGLSEAVRLAVESAQTVERCRQVGPVGGGVLRHHVELKNSLVRASSYPEIEENFEKQYS